MTTFAAISDTHTRDLSSILAGTKADVLLHCGDALYGGGISEWMIFLRQIENIRENFKHVIFSPGNHDIHVSNHPRLCYAELKALECDLIIHETITINGIRVFCSPYTPRYGNWSFMRERGDAIRSKWSQIPTDTDVLVTHGPPFGVLDKAFGREHVGCWDLLDVVTTFVKPQYHCFGHIHFDGGRRVTRDATTFINCAVVDESYDVDCERDIQMFEVSDAL